MSDNYNQRSQGVVAVPKKAQRLATRAPVTAAQVKREVQADLIAKDRAETKPRPPQKVGGLQDWRKG